MARVEVRTARPTSGALAWVALVLSSLAIASAPNPADGALPAPGSPYRQASFAVGTRTLRLVDTSRVVRALHGRSRPRTLVTVLRYPALGAPGHSDTPYAPAVRGPFPLIVFAHGFAVTPVVYAGLLDGWARAGYVVAAPVFPGESPHAPGGPDESDLVNEPADISFVISQLLAAGAAPSGPLAGLLDPTHVAVAGQSDGGEAALAVAYARRLRDPRVGAAVILSGAEMSGIGGYGFAAAGPALLAAQGTADTTNEPRFTYAFYKAARRPKYLLRLLGAQHLPPYTRQQPQLSIVERVSIAFLDGYLKGQPAALQQLLALGSVPGAAALSAVP